MWTLRRRKLLLIRAQNDVQGSFADLSARWVMRISARLSSHEEPAPPLRRRSGLILQQALKNRPELIGQRLDVNSAQSYATAERDLYFPTISALGAAGLTPVRQDPLTTAMPPGASTSTSRFSTGTSTARARGGHRAGRRRKQHDLRDLQETASCGTFAPRGSTPAGFQRLCGTDQLLNEATQALNLAQSRYELGLEFHRRAEPGAVEPDAGADRAGQRQDTTTRLRCRC